MSFISKWSVNFCLVRSHFYFIIIRLGDLHAKIIVLLAHVFHLKVVSELLLDALHFVQVRPSDENIERNEIEFVANVFHK